MMICVNRVSSLFRAPWSDCWNERNNDGAKKGVLGRRAGASVVVPLHPPRQGQVFRSTTDKGTAGVR